MSSKIAHYLQEHIAGEVETSADVRRFFSTDKSIFSIPPALVVYPRTEQDVRKTARFSWQLAERERILPITARGGGSDVSGAAIGSGIILVFPAHMNRILELDSKSGVVTVEPGTNFGTLQQTLKTYGRNLPPCPASADYATVGGAVADRSSGESSVKYGPIRGYVRNLRVVLANGEAIDTGRISKRELGKKLGLTSLEGEIYRTLDGLLEDGKEAIATLSRSVTKNNAGYDLQSIRHKDGSFDLTPLIVGSQGTLGIITEITLETELYNPESAMLAAFFDSVEHVQSAVSALKHEHDLPSVMELVDGNLLSFAASINPNALKGAASLPYPKFILLVGYDDTGRSQRKHLKQGMAILKRYATQVQDPSDADGQELLRKLRELSSAALSHSIGNAKALPLIEDGVVPIDQLGAFIQGIYAIFERNHAQAAIWGHAGDANLHVHPLLDLSQIGDRQRMQRMMDEYYKLVITLGGSITGEHGDGRLRGPYLEKMYGREAYELLEKVKKIFDPYGTLNPGVKIGAKPENVKPFMRQEYSLDHLYKFMPRS